MESVGEMISTQEVLVPKPERNKQVCEYNIKMCAYIDAV